MTVMYTAFDDRVDSKIDAMVSFRAYHSDLKIFNIIIFLFISVVLG